ncbi:MAG: hypothetical protein AB8H03_09220 [Saprospiraceae bacterium]
MKSKIVFVIFSFLANLTFGQTRNNINSDWNGLKNAAHQIGFCIYHPSKKHCKDHSNELTKREKSAPEDLDIYYFEMKKEWAQNRLNKWSEQQAQPTENFLILFDIAQNKPSEKLATETFNLFRGFVLIDLTDSIQFIFSKKEKNKMTIKSDGKNALMENTLWREFMTGRLGRFSNNIEFDLIGKNAESDFEDFRKAFLFFQKNTP